MMSTSVETRSREMIAIDNQIEALQKKRKVLRIEKQIYCNHSQIADVENSTDHRRVCLNCGVTELRQGVGYHLLKVTGPLIISLQGSVARNIQEGDFIGGELKEKLFRAEDQLAVFREHLREELATLQETEEIA